MIYFNHKANIFLAIIFCSCGLLSTKMMSLKGHFVNFKFVMLTRLNYCYCVNRLMNQLKYVYKNVSL